MPLSSAVRDRVRAFLSSEEEIRFLFPGTAVSVGTSLGSLFGMAGYLVAVTDRRVVVLAGSWFRRHRPVSLWAEYPRTTVLGPVDTSLTPTITLGGLVLEVDEEYVPVIRAADAELAGADCLPPDPLPHL
ncbi:hypothetical protein LX15_002283 [Streptoalloteichus tenebrarius]|uniref:Uncharacterized protein n=1 Tax=Streptoalloteichus tenebrarius (strain ATCC 17920 / DSM 40477 / JCM 4838 / CBS 697.72 / NBRC 16177 / NCIMB 11028 / NRRL B-12390 / A12253. 1 / ISP 5477) TaxID=1933 RepID=A0ABT1HST2_STRSD|nr:hypothetical protein [Streptoalloteichus tenebrarius]MCP2258585.1 hypothetical protein [Streptoalloteichus tenebrarius]BFF04043.1 hypothetical protein GCM10020241_57180 [Streptoalloteichus tenebrarius]